MERRPVFRSQELWRDSIRGLLMTRTFSEHVPLTVLHCTVLSGGGFLHAYEESSPAVLGERVWCEEHAREARTTAAAVKLELIVAGVREPERNLRPTHDMDSPGWIRPVVASID
ncbi:hypothetical protein DAEQUDRAFT_84706 [Daedalea quercina L-15889]|uniref:Uncharacterized protein n=1 Tax=Daedalea quercina L-15889 TaxID=1314783 RepID=A0A165L192_9APHY|nr:hypothetical protein DAEQUDRAFT_84706 [Daedalea quercina L-15889]